MFFLLLWGLAWADPCKFDPDPTVQNPQPTDSYALAYDSDEDSWATGTRLFLGLEVLNQPLVEQVGVMVDNNAAVTYDLTIWYKDLETGEASMLLEEAGELPAGSNQGWWMAGVQTGDLLWDMETDSQVGFQVLCEDSPADTGYDTYYEGGFSSAGVGCGCQSAPTLTMADWLGVICLGGFAMLVWAIERRD